MQSKQTKLIFIVLTLTLLFVTINILNSQVWHKVYQKQSVYVETHRNQVGDSSAIYDVLDKSGDAMIIKSTDLGKIWETIYYEYGKTLEPFRGVRKMERPAPGSMFILYWDGGIKKIDERTGTLLDSIVLTAEGDPVQYTAFSYFSMLDTNNGVAGSGFRSYITRDGWKSLIPIKNVYYVEKEGNPNYPQGMQVFETLMLHPDTIMFYGLGGENNVRYPVGFYKMIIAKDSTLSYKLMGDTLDKNNRAMECMQFKLLSRDTWVYTGYGEKLGGDARCHEIYKTDDGGHTFRQVHKDCISPTFGLSDIDFKDSLNGIAVGNHISLMTSDGGETWEINKLYYDENWEFMDDDKNPWVSWIDYVDGMAFLGTWAYDLYKLEDKVGAIDEVEYTRHRLYPNPIQAGKQLTIENMYFLNAIANIYDIHGQQVDGFYFHGNSISISRDLAHGTYFLVVEENGKYPVREKFIVE